MKRLRLQDLYTKPELLTQIKKALFSQWILENGECYTPHPGQAKIHFEYWQNHVAVWGRRGGKTQAAAGEGLIMLGIPNTRTWIVAPTHNLTHKVFRLIWKAVVDDEIYGPGSVVKCSNSRDSRYIEMKWGSWIEGKSAEKPKGLLGEGLDLLIFDEAAEAPSDIWDEYLEPTLLDRKGRALFITTPEGYDWIYDLWEEGRDPEGEGYKQGWRSSQIESADNPYLDRQWIEDKKRRTPHLIFLQEYKAQFVAKRGVIYPDFKDRLWTRESPAHLYNDDMLLIQPGWTHYRAIDPGSNNPTACIWAAVDTKNDVWVYDEYEARSTLVRDHALAINAKTSYPICTTVIDPKANSRNDETGRSTKDLYEYYGIYTQDALNNVQYGYQVVSEYLRATLEHSSELPKVYIHATKCPKLIRYLNQYQWDSNRSYHDKNAPDKPRKYKDHLPDALRYLLASKPIYIPSHAIAEQQRQFQDDETTSEQISMSGNPWDTRQIGFEGRSTVGI